jgi:zinc transport system substrate-binding protein
MLVILALTAIACQRESDEPKGDELSIVTTTYPLSYMARRIVEDRAVVRQLVKAGVEAHDFEPAPSDVRTIANADIFVYNHPSFEGWALNAANATSSGNSGTTVTVQTIDLESAGENHGGEAVDDSTFDAHVWLNPLKAQEQASHMLSAFIEADPEGKESYTRNASALESELRALDELIATRLANCDLDSVVVSHLAFGHMAERYGFAQIGLAGLSPEFESGPAQLAGVIKKINELGIRHILQEPIVSDRLAETAAAETGTELLTLHPLAVRTLAEAFDGVDYFDVMKANAETLHMALQCS